MLNHIQRHSKRLSLAILLVSLWQLEIVWIGYSTGWGYNFGGLGDLNLKLWQWRDFYYIMLCLSWVLLDWYKDLGGGKD